MTLLAAWHTLPDIERRARLRALQALARVLADEGRRELVDALRTAETEPAALARCDAALDALATVPCRRILTTFLETLPVSAQ